MRPSRLVFLSASFLAPVAACVGDTTAPDGGGSDATSSDVTLNDAVADSPPSDGGDGAVVYTYSPSLSDKSKWETFDTTPLSFINGNGGVFDGTYVYFVGSKILQYDPAKPFGAQASYAVFDPSTTLAPS